MNETKIKKPLASYSIWYRVCLGIFALVALINLLGIVGWITGHTLEIFYGIDGLLHEVAMENNYLIMYMNYFGIIASVVMIALAIYNIRECVIDKEFTFDKIRGFMILTAVSIWSVPLYNAVADLALVASRMRSILSFDLFDLGMTAWPMLICTVLCIAVLVVNIFLGDVPANEEIE